MMRVKKIATLLFAIGVSAPAFATNGYFSHGYGMKAKGMAGAATAVTGDTFGGANNPATMVSAGNRLDAGIDYFSPKRDASRAGSPFGGLFDGSSSSGTNSFYVPELGYNRMLGSDMAVGVTVYGNGGMNTDYSDRVANCGAGAASSNLLCGTTRLGVDLTQLIIAPTFSMKLNKSNSIGISALFGYQQFAASGLEAFTPGSSSPTNVTGNGHDSSTGLGLRLGWLGQVSDTVSLGASYSPRMHMKKFSKYQGLFAEGGAFDLPENYSLGIAVKATPQLLVAADYQVMNYSKIPSVGNPSNSTGLLGTSNGAGFGWGNVQVLKLGLEYAYSKDLTLRAGYSAGKNPIQSRDVMFNILAPGVIKDHVTLGFTCALGGGELSAAYMHAFSNSVSGNEAAPPAGFGGTPTTIKMYQNSLGVAYGWKF